METEDQNYENHNSAKTTFSELLINENSTVPYSTQLNYLAE